ncbi:MAG: RNA-binding S4 domain-containing protein [Rhodocyclaceae bacterium]|nr:RNA-binding S4 domain-containing protein [Rhodocyclaceae bacterium]
MPSPASTRTWNSSPITRACPPPILLNKRLWAARIFKTRSQAAAAADGGKVKLNGAAAKPARELKPGDRLHIRTEGEDWDVEVVGFNAQRRPAAEARLLYRETAESMKQRAEAAELRRLTPLPQADTKGRPTKRDRRQLNRLHGGE